VLRKEAAKVVGDERAAGSILVWNGLVTRIRHAIVETERASRMDVELARQTPHDSPKPRTSGKGSGS
jgi:hypothetical protein